MGYFYGSNIHPQTEYQLRENAIKQLAAYEKFLWISAFYDPSEWYCHTRALAAEPERGKRCKVCFELQLRSAAFEALRQGCTHFGTTLTISPHKDAAFILNVGMQIADETGLKWFDRIWRKNDGFLRSVRISRELGIYRQNYCGCLYSNPSLPKGDISDGSD